VPLASIARHTVEAFEVGDYMLRRPIAVAGNKKIPPLPARGGGTLYSGWKGGDRGPLQSGFFRRTDGSGVDFFFDAGPLDRIQI